jgi:Domain of unknown function (DUF4190)
MPVVSSSTASSKTEEPVSMVASAMADANQVSYAASIQAPVVASQQQPFNNAPAKFSGAPMGNSAAASQPAKKNSGKAVASLICAILGLFVLGIVLGPVAICLAVAAKNDIKEKPDQVGGECMATSGLIIGIIGFVLSIIILVVVYA